MPLFWVPPCRIPSCADGGFRKPVVVVAGHMNVANMEDYCLLQTHVNGLAFDVANHRVSNESLNAGWLNVEDTIASVHFVYFDSVNDQSVMELEETLQELRPDVLILDVLSEDLANLPANSSPYRVANSVVNCAWRVQSYYGVKVTYIMGGLRRTTGLNCSADQFAARMQNCHGQIKILASQFPNVLFMRTRGFSRMSNGGTMPVAYFTTTGFVPGPQFSSYGFRRYYRAVRKVLLAGAGRFTAGRLLGWW